MGVPENQQKGTDLEKVIISNNLCILNNKSPIYLNPSTHSYSAIAPSAGAVEYTVFTSAEG